MGVGAGGGGLVRNREGDPDGTCGHPGPPRCMQAAGFRNRGARGGEEGGGQTWPGGRRGTDARQGPSVCGGKWQALWATDLGLTCGTAEGEFSEAL